MYYESKHYFFKAYSSFISQFYSIMHDQSTKNGYRCFHGMAIPVNLVSSSLNMYYPLGLNLSDIITGKAGRNEILHCSCFLLCIRI